jgi:hypothetical protein
MLFSRVLGGTGADEAHAASLAPGGALIVAGETSSANFPTTPGAFDTTPGFFRAFVSRLSTTDGQVLQSTFLNGSQFDKVFAVTTDASGAVYATGSTSSPDFPTTPGVVQTTVGGNNAFGDAFVAKLKADLSGVIYSTFLGGADTDSGVAVAVDGTGQAVVVGSTTSSNFPLSSPLVASTPSSVRSFITKLSPNGSQFVYSTYWPATLSSLALGASGDAYVAGVASGALINSTYPTTTDALLAPRVNDSVNHGVFARISDASPACSYQLQPSVYVVFSSSSSTQSINVVAPSNCSWTASSDDPTWLNPTVTSGTGIGTVTFSVGSLTSGVRSANLTVGDANTHQSVTIYQRSCFVSAPSSPPAQPVSGGAIVVDLTGPAGCPFVAGSDAPWLTITPAFDVMDSTGHGQVAVTVAANPNLNSRTASVFVSDTPRSGGSFQIQQAGHCTAASVSFPSFAPLPFGGSVPVAVTVSPADCQWTAKSNASWLTPSVSSAVGSQTITVTAAPTTAGGRSGVLVIAGFTFSITQNGLVSGLPPAVYPPSPAAGSGADQTFTFTFFDPHGATKLDVVNVLINNFLDGGSACYLAYARSIHVLYLVNDPGDALLPGLVLNGGGQSVGNSQCQVDGSASSAVEDGNVLTLTLKLTFGAQFTGNKVVYQAARNVDGFNSGWVQQGVWNIPAQTAAPLEVIAMAPARNSGTSYPFQFTFRDLAGADHLVSTSILINGYLDGFRGCYLGYHVPSNSVLLLNDAGDGYLGSVVLGTNTTIENSQCRIKALPSGSVSNGTDLTLNLTIEFKAGFAGEHVFYVSAQDDTGTSGWQALGSWTSP